MTALPAFITSNNGTPMLSPYHHVPAATLSALVVIGLAQPAISICVLALLAGLACLTSGRKRFPATGRGLHARSRKG